MVDDDEAAKAMLTSGTIAEGVGASDDGLTTVRDGSWRRAKLR